MNIQKTRLFIAILLITIITFLSACAAEELQTSTTVATDEPNPVEEMAPSSTPTEPPPTETPLPTNTPLPTPTEITYSLEVVLFHDHNGNEIQNENETFVQGLKLTVEENSCITDEKGSCALGDFSQGRYQLNIDNSDTEISNLEYLFLENDVFSRVWGLDLTIDENTTLTIPVSQGPIPLPVLSDSGYMGYGFGDLHELDYQLTPHTGIDFEITGFEPQPIFAPVSGILRPVPLDENPPWGECGHVTIEYSGPGSNGGVQVGIGHLTEVVVSPNTPITKGEIIGYVDPSLYPAPNWIACTSHPHIHMNIWGNVPGESWPRDGSGLPWEPLPNGEWGWLNPELYLPLIETPIPMFLSLDEANMFANQ